MRCLCELEGWQLLSTPAKEPFGERERGEEEKEGGV